MHTPKQPRQHIESIRLLREKNDPNSTSFANTLESNIFTAFKGENKFILELLQNADDAAIAEKETSVHIIHVNDYIIFIHNGKPFSQQDVEKICDNAQDQYTDKSENANQTGYKGIGFKSIFSIAKCVYIKSGGYSFRFDEVHFAQRSTRQNKYPWPVIPIWTEENDIPAEINSQIRRLNYADATTTFFVLSLRDREDIQSQVQLFKNEPINILFLRNINSIAFSSPRSSWTIARAKTHQNYTNIYIDDTIHSTWLLNQFSFEIPEPTKLSIQKLKRMECPDRLKEAKSTTLTFAIQIKNGKIVFDGDGRLFCYLPTQVRSSIPTLINGDFLLNVERTQLVQNQWNEFLLGGIAICLFKWMAQLAILDLYRQQILKLLPPTAVSHLSPWCNQSYQQGYNYARDNIPFLPSQFEPNKLLKLSQAVYDSTRFFVNFPEVERDNEFVNGSLENIAEIKPLLKKTFHPDDVLALITTKIITLPIYRQIAFQARILAFLTKIPLTPLQKNNLGQKLLLSDAQEIGLHILSQLYFRKDAIELPVKADIKFINSKLYSEFPQIKDFLISLGVKEFNPDVFIREHLLKLIQSNAIPATALVTVHVFLRQYHTNFLPHSPEWQVIKRLPVWVSTRGESDQDLEKYGLSDVAKCYFPPDSATVFGEDRAIYVHSIYAWQTANNTSLQANIAQWREYFSKLGISNAITLRILSSIKGHEIKRMLPVLGERYIEYLQKTISIKSGDIEILNFPYMEFLDQISDENYSRKFFWPALTANATTLCSTTTLANGAAVDNIIQYIFKEYPILHSTQGVACKSGELFFYKVQSDFHPFINIAQTPLQISEQLAKFLGIRINIGLHECLQILSQIGMRQEPVTISLYEVIFSHILALEYQLTTTDRLALTSWQGRLPAHDGTLQTKTLLFHFAITTVDISPSPYWLIRLRLSDPQMKRIAELFGIRILTDVDVNFENTGIVDDTQIKNNIIQRCSYLAIITAKETKTEYAKCLEKYKQIMTSISVKASNELFITVQAKTENSNTTIRLQNVFAHVNQNTLYIDCSLGISSLTVTTISRFVATKLGLTGKAYNLLSSIIELEQTRLEILLAKEGYTQDFLQRNMRIDNTPTTPSRVVQLSESTPNTPLPSSSLQTPPSVRTKLSSEEAKQNDLLEQIQNMHIGTQNSRTNEFVPSVRADQVVVTQIQLEKFNSHHTQTVTMQKPLSMQSYPEAVVGHFPIDMNASSPSSSVKPNTPVDPRLTYKEQLDLAAIGKWAEYLVFRFLYAYYQQKFPRAVITETQDGFMFNANNKQQILTQYRLIWHNKHNESYGPRDLTLLKGKEERVIEVKGTINESGVVHVSAEEWNTMVAYKNKYRLYRVSGVGQPNPHIVKIKDPAQAICTNQFRINKVEFKL